MTLNDLHDRVQVLYVGTVDMGRLNGREAVMAAVSELFDGQYQPPSTVHVELCATTDGIMFTDNLHRCTELYKWSK